MKAFIKSRKALKLQKVRFIFKLCVGCFITYSMCVTSLVCVSIE